MSEGKLTGCRDLFARLQDLQRALTRLTARLWVALDVVVPGVRVDRKVERARVHRARPLRVRSAPHGQRRRRAVAQAADDATALDTSSPVKRRSNGPLVLDPALRGRQICRPPLYADLVDEYDSDEDSDESQPVLWKQPPRRFGIFCTPKPGQRRMGGMRR